MAEEREALGLVQAPPPFTGEEAQARIQAGLGSSRYKEYDINAYAAMVQVAVPQALWSGVFFSWMSVKGHLQALHGFDRTEAFITQVEDTVYATFIVVWDTADALAAWLESGYPTTEMLANIGIPAEDIRMQLVRDFS